MNKRTPGDDDTLFDVFDKKQRMEVTEEAKEKSLLAFQAGLTEAGPHHAKRKRPMRGGRVIGFSASLVAIGIAVVLALSPGTFGVGQPENMPSQGSGGDQEQQDVDIGTDDDAETEEIDDVIIEGIWNRQPFDYDASEDFQTMSIFNDDLQIYLPEHWKVSENEGEDTYSIELSGNDGEQMNLVLFQDQTVFDAHLQEVTERFAEAEHISVPADEFVDEIKVSQEMFYIYDHVFPFEIDHAEMTTFVDQTSGKLMDLYTSDLFGYPMIFTSELALDDVNSWNLPIHLFATMRIGGALVVHGSEGELHPAFNRPMEKTVLLPIGAASRPDGIDMELYANEELQVSSYLPLDAEVQRIEHEHYIEWRFTEPHIPETSYYSFGKLKSSFPLEGGKEMTFAAFDIDPNHSDHYEEENLYAFSYDSANAGEGIGTGGYVELFEASGEWYYVRKHADWNSYNGGFYSARLHYFLDSLEWQ